MSKEKYFTIFNIKVFAKLVLMGYKPSFVERNMSNKKYFVFKFKDTETFREDLEKVLKEYKSEEDVL